MVRLHSACLIICLAVVSSRAALCYAEVSGLVTSPSPQQDIVSYKDWSLVLSVVVDKQGKVYYPRFFEPKVRQAFSRFLTLLEEPLPAGYSKEAEMSYWLNAYNALTMRHVLRFPGLESVAIAVKGEPRYTFFKQRVHLVGGEKRSLDDIEHQLIRPRFKDPRVHMALNCASKSCPVITNIPFMAQTLDQQLDHLASKFVNDPSRNQLRSTSSPTLLRLSKLFSWFGEDFKYPLSVDAVGDRTVGDRTVGDRTVDIERGVKAFLCKHSELNMSLIEDSHIQYLEYDWRLNGVPPGHHWTKDKHE